MTKLITLSVREELLPILAQIEKVRPNSESLSAFLLGRCTQTYLESINENKCPSINASMSEWKRFLGKMDKNQRFEFSEHLNRLVLLERKEFMSRL